MDAPAAGGAGRADAGGAGPRPADAARPIRPIALWEELDALLGAAEPASREDELRRLLPELDDTFGFDQRNPHHDFDVGEHLLRTLARMAELTDDVDLRLAALLHDVGKPHSLWVDAKGRGHFYARPDVPRSRDHAAVGAEIAERAMRRLGYRDGRVRRVAQLVRGHMVAFDSERGARRLLERAGSPRVASDLLLLKEADDAAKVGGDPDPRVHRMRRLLDALD